MLILRDYEWHSDNSNLSARPHTGRQPGSVMQRYKFVHSVYIYSDLYPSIMTLYIPYFGRNLVLALFLRRFA